MKSSDMPSSMHGVSFLKLHPEKGDTGFPIFLYLFFFLNKRQVNGTLVKCTTTVNGGSYFILEIKHEWAPLGAKRFMDLVDDNFWEGVSGKTQDNDAYKIQRTRCIYIIEEIVWLERYTLLSFVVAKWARSSPPLSPFLTLRIFNCIDRDIHDLTVSDTMSISTFLSPSQVALFRVIPGFLVQVRDSTNLFMITNR